MDEFEALLKDKDRIRDRNKEINPFGEIKKMPQADKNALLSDLFSMIQETIMKTIKNKNVVFLPDEKIRAKLALEEQLDKNYISYKTVNRKPKDSIKPRIKTVFDEKIDSSTERIGEVKEQIQECIIQFDIYSNSYEQIEELMSLFENKMYTYTGYFKQQGVSEIFFKGQVTDDKLDRFRQKTAIRSLRYYVEIAKLYVTYDDIITEINTTQNVGEIK